jgi:murein DD-endopeptidase MepM/ murein hydrolase activator NlpD
LSQSSQPRAAGARRSPTSARIITWTAVFALAVAAVRLTPPEVEPQPLATVLAPAAPEWRESVDTLASGETLSKLLGRAGVGVTQVTHILQSATSIDARRVRPGLTVRTRQRTADSVPSEVVFQLAIDHLLRVTRGDSGWVAVDEHLPWTVDTVAVSGVISSNLYTAMATSAAGDFPEQARTEVAWSLADIFEYKADMSRDLRVGDKFRLLVERKSGPQGAVRSGNILVASFTLSGNEVQAVRHELKGGKAGYYDQEGRSMKAAFLRAPLEFRRISSVFGRRKHPVLGTWRAHKGTDYAANSGTPVRAIGDGTVIFRGRKGGYGNTLEIRHRNGFVTRYGHLRGFAKAAQRGAHVTIGQTVAYVGATGLATGPHLHFEVLVGGVQRDPRTALSRDAGEPLPKGERGAFDASRERLLALLDRFETRGQLASR